MRRLLVVVWLMAGIACAPSLISLVGQMSYQDAAYVPATGARYAEPLRELRARLEAHGVQIGVSGEITGVGATYRTEEGAAILLHPSLEPDGQFEVLAHEAGHLCHPRLQDVHVRELLAESVGVGIQEFYGSKTARLSGAQYLAVHKHALAGWPYIKRDVQRCIQIMTGRRRWDL